jgi:hypothetical protein
MLQWIQPRDALRSRYVRTCRFELIRILCERILLEQLPNSIAKDTIRSMLQWPIWCRRSIVDLVRSRPCLHFLLFRVSKTQQRICNLHESFFFKCLISASEIISLFPFGRPSSKYRVSHTPYRILVSDHGYGIFSSPGLRTMIRQSAKFVEARIVNFRPHPSSPILYLGRVDGSFVARAQEARTLS